MEIDSLRRHSGETQPKRSLIPRPSHRPVFDRLQYAKTEFCFDLVWCLRFREKGGHIDVKDSASECSV